MAFFKVILSEITVHMNFCSFFAIFSLWNNYTSIIFLLQNIHVPFCLSTTFNPLFAPQLPQFFCQWWMLQEKRVVVDFFGFAAL